MPLNTLRLNHQVSSHPNNRIVFIKPIPRTASRNADYDRAELTLKAIAAQCLPIMKSHYLSVTTLEEYEPNPEFIGRNFNNGEVIQLVLQSKSGAWLPLNMVQMVMMHELAHNTHMNHGRGFWQARNLYANEMRQLWSKGYTGEGLWGRGTSLNMLENTAGNAMANDELADLTLCGGTFRSRQKKRKAKGKGQDVSWKEKRDRRIKKKFGKNGEALGEDEDKRLRLEINRKGASSLGAKPRVAQSKRGRELRAAAALARFDTTKKESAKPDLNGDDETETETESEYEEVDAGEEDATDQDGRKLLDSKGRSVIRICEEANWEDADVRNEMQELRDLDVSKVRLNKRNENNTIRASSSPSSNVVEESRDFTTAAAPESERPCRDLVDEAHLESVKVTHQARSRTANMSSGPQKNVAAMVIPSSAEIHCSICSMANALNRATCLACAHVLDTRKDSRHWHCTSEVCTDNQYVNAGDCGVCGICGTRKAV